MINIFYNANHPELVFAISAFISSFDKRQEDEICDIIPIRTVDLNKDLQKLKIALDDEIEVIEGERYFDDPDDVDSEPIKYALFGIYPKNEEEANIISHFFDNNAENIMLWLDWHSWPENLLSFLSYSDRIKINRIKTCLEVMDDNNYFVLPLWLETEKAMISCNMDNMWAARYWKTFLVSKAAGHNAFAENANDYIVFLSFVDEILNGKENENISLVEDSFESMAEETEEMIEKFVDDHPIFAEAKKIGRPVGCLMLGEVSDHFNSEDILEGGKKKYPWLCVLRYVINGLAYVYFESEKLPVNDIINAYQYEVKKEAELLQLVNEELLRFKE